jgi:peroxiredoxin family protein
MSDQTGRDVRGDELSSEQHLEALVERKVAERFERLQASIEHALAQPRPAATTQPTNRAALFVFSGDMDRLMAAFTIAGGAAALGMQVSMFFTFWGLTGVKKTTILAGKSVPEKLLSLMLPRTPASAGTSKLNMLGMGPSMLKSMMRKNKVETLPSLIAVARELGVRLIACQMTMSIMGITQNELLADIEYGGVTTYLAEASDARITLFF